MLIRILPFMLSLPCSAAAVPRLLAPAYSSEAVLPVKPSSPLRSLSPSPLNSLSPLPLTPLALQTAPLLAASVDSRVPLEASAVSGEKTIALLQGADPLKRVRAVEVVPGVIHLKFPSQRLLASTMLRFQEHYESPKYRGKAFSLDEFKAWYAAEQSKTGRFTYYKDWDGFNIPSRVLRRFRKGDFDPLDPKERALLARFADRKGRFYLIGTAAADADKSVLRHEVAHGLWYTRPAYRRRAQALLRGVNLKPVYKMLERLGYHKSVWLDEAHAWLGDSAADVRSEGLNPKPYKAIRAKLRALQKEFVSGDF